MALYKYRIIIIIIIIIIIAIIIISLLRSSHALKVTVPRTRTVFDSFAFSVAAPTVWNSLADNVVNSDTLATFKKRLTHLFHCVL